MAGDLPALAAGAGVSVEGLFDHVARIWRPIASKGQYREEVRDYAPVTDAPDEPNAAVNRPRTPYADPSAGLAPVGTRIIYMAADADVQGRDIVQLVSGPDAPGTFEVDEPPTRPRGHHTELRCVAWHGTLTEGS